MSFNEAQQRVLDHDGMELLVIAGAGSGKTHVLTEFNARLILRGVAPGNLAIFTFTRRAANEMKTRLEQRLGGDETARRMVSQITIGTFHSIAYRILRAWGHRLGYDATHLTVVPPHEADTLLRQVGGEFGFYQNKKWSKGLSWFKVSDWREAYYTGREIQPASRTERGMLDAILNEYINRLRGAQALDFGLILKEVKRLFEIAPDVLWAYQQSIKSVTVDEAQDTDREQYNLHQYFLPMRGGQARVILVGDRRQAIYGFRGADASLLTTCYPRADIIDLQACYRCSARVVDAANRLIAHNDDPLAAPMVSVTGTSGLVEAFSGEIGVVVEKIAELRGLYEDHEIAVLARSHRILAQVESAMEQSGMPSQRVGQSRDLAASDEFSKIHAALRLVQNRRDRLAFALLATDLEVNEESRLRLVAAANAGTPIVDAYLQHCQSNALGRLLADTRVDHRVVEVVHALRDLINGDAHDLDRAAAFWLRDEGRTIEAALAWYADLDFDKGEDHEPTGKVTLITAHAAKGLEWPAIIVAGMNEGVFPSNKAIKADKLNEERCLAYVAITRTKSYVGLHCLAHPETGHGPPSRFIAEAGIHLSITEDDHHAIHAN